MVVSALLRRQGRAVGGRRYADQKLTKPGTKQTNTDQQKKKPPKLINNLDGSIGGGGGSRTRVRRRLTPGTTCLARR